MTYTNWEYVREVPVNINQIGIVARRRIPEGTLIGIYQGDLRRFRLDKGRLPDTALHKNIVQIACIGEELFGFVREERSGIGYINHSCQPNVTARDRIILVTSRTVEEGEPLTIDYRTWDLVPEGIRCWCPEPRCEI